MTTPKIAERRRKREYLLWAQFRGGPFTNVRNRVRPPYWRYEVYATSIRQAYAVAAKEAFAADARSVGVRVMETDWWHRGAVKDDEEAEGRGYRLVAPYLRRAA